MNEKRADNNIKIVYYIDFSIQEIPHITYIAREAGGTILTNYQITFDTISREFPDLEVKLFNSIEEIRLFIKEKNIKIIVYPDYHIRFFKDINNVKHVQVFHGISDKSYDYSRKVLEYDLFFIPGKHSYERYMKKGLLKKGTGRMIGYPKFDRVFSGALNRTEISRKIGLNGSLPTVLYAPTWVDKAFNSSWKKFYKYILYDKPAWLNLIIKPHPNLIRYRKQEIEECKKHSKIDNTTILLTDVFDITPILAVSDLLVGDVSSVTREFLAFKRPFVFLSNKPKWMWNKSKISLWECGDVVTKPEYLWNTVEKALENPDKYMENILKNFEQTFYKPDGRASKRAAEEIYRLIGK